MKNKFIKLTALWIVVVGLAACQSNNVDVFGISNDLALGNMPGYYTFTEVDSTAMTVTKLEYTLVKQVDGVGKGNFRKSVTGMCAPVDESKPFTWSAVMAENKLSMIVTLTYEDENVEEFRWSEGVLHLINKTSAKTGRSSIDALNKNYEDLANIEFVLSEKEYYPHPDTIDFIAWKTEVEFFAPEDTAAQKAAYLNELTPYLDTIKWYLGYAGQIGTVYLDPVTGELQNLVVVSPEPSTRGKNKGKHGITYVVQIDTLQTRVEQIDDRPMKILNSSIAFNRAGNTNIGSYYYHIQEWGEEYYQEPSVPEAMFDSTYTFDASAWALTKVVDENVFDVLFKGSENGQTDDAFTTFSISEYNREKGELIIGTYKYKLKQ